MVLIKVVLKSVERAQAGRRSPVRLSSAASSCARPAFQALY